MRKMKRWKSTFGVLALALLLTVSLAPTAAFADEAAAEREAFFDQLLANAKD